MQNKNNKQQIYIVRKFVLASSALEAIKKEKTIQPHDVWLEENTQREIVLSMSKNNELKGFK